MIQTQVDIDGVAALRDFFLARNGSELERTYRTITGHFLGTAPLVENWNDIEFKFNRLFVGPGRINNKVGQGRLMVWSKKNLMPHNATVLLLREHFLTFLPYRK